MNCTDKIVSIITDLELNSLDAGGTDKISIHSYGEVYGKYLARYQESEGNLLELGVRFGGSSILWQELLPKFNLCLVDVEDNLTENNIARFDPQRTKYFNEDGYTETFRDKVVETYKRFDFITDDGPHTLESQIKCVDLYLPFLSANGVMVIEDIDPESIEPFKAYLDLHLSGDHTYKVFDLRNVKGRFDDIAVVIGSKSVVEMKPKIVMITMFKNEAGVMRRMLESCYKYIDYFVIQNNGSTDGTDTIVKEFFAEKKIPGMLYDVEEGWVGFGWNRDHLIQVCQSVDHGCDWILKMDCDEVLQVADDFDWTPLENKQTQAFHVASLAGNCIYYRAWMWNAELPWRFNHDPCHETVYCELPGVGENFERVNLDPKFCHIGYNEGQSWSNPTKFITDALVLEEKMIKNDSFSQDLYHFWYIGKSYFDCYTSHAFPLGDSQRKEYAKRGIYYFNEYKNHCKEKQVGGIELPYMSCMFMAEMYGFLGMNDQAISSYEEAASYCPERNDHWYSLAHLYEKTGEYRKMLSLAHLMIHPHRVCPFPHYIVFIDVSLYPGHSENKLNILLERAQQHVNTLKVEEENKLPFMINLLPRKRLFVVDNFYQDPDVVRNYALTKVEYHQDTRWFKGLRSTTVYRPPGIKEAFESILGEKVENFEAHGYNGVFQICTSADPQVYHFDTQKWAAMIYLNPVVPIESGTRLHRSRRNGTRDSREWGIDAAFEGDFLDSTRHDITDNAGNIYNRVVLMDAKCIHSAGPYFGNSKETGRLTHLFFFD